MQKVCSNIFVMILFTSSKNLLKTKFDLKANQRLPTITTHQGYGTNSLELCTIPMTYLQLKEPLS